MTSMTPKERVMAAFEKRPTDKVPIYQAGFSSRAASYVLKRDAYVGGGRQQWRESVALWRGPEAHSEFIARSQQDCHDLARALDLDLIRPSYWRLTEKPTRRIDEFTFLYGDPAGRWRVMRHDPVTELYQVVDQSPEPELTMADVERQVAAEEQSLASYHPKPEGFADAKAALDAFGEERAVPGSGVGCNIDYRRPIWLEAMAVRPDLVARHLMTQAERAVRCADAQHLLGLRILFGGGDFCSQRGPFYSPRLFHELTLPALRRISDGCHRNGQYHCFATDGDAWPVADDLLGASGVDCFYEIDGRAGMDLARLRTRFPHLTCLGNIASYSLHRGSRQEVIRETLDCLDKARKYGGCVVGCSNQIVSETPEENLWAMMETLHAYRDC